MYTPQSFSRETPTYRWPVIVNGHGLQTLPVRLFGKVYEAQWLGVWYSVQLGEFPSIQPEETGK